MNKLIEEAIPERSNAVLHGWRAVEAVGGVAGEYAVAEQMLRMAMTRCIKRERVGQNACGTTAALC